MSNTNFVASPKTFFPFMLATSGFIGSIIGIFFSLYFIDIKGLNYAIHQGTFWVLESICLPYAFAGFFFEDAFHDRKRFSICTKESSIVFFTFSVAMMFIHYGKFSLPCKLTIAFCFLREGRGILSSAISDEYTCG